MPTRAIELRMRLCRVPNDEELLALHKVEPKQDLFSIAAGSWDFYHLEGGYQGTVSYVNSEHLLKENIKAVLKRGSDRGSL